MSLQYSKVDLSDVLAETNPHWREAIVEFARLNAHSSLLGNDAAGTLEEESGASTLFKIVDGNKIAREMPWLFDLYYNELRDIAQGCTTEEVLCGQVAKSAVNINLQQGNMRHQVHLDTNPVTGLLYLTTHSAGGELVVAHDSEMCGFDVIESAAPIQKTVIKPAAGNFVVSDFRAYPHYTRPLTDDDDVRAVLVLNFYTPSCREDERPKSLDPIFPNEEIDVRDNEGRFYAPFTTYIEGKPIIVYPARDENPLDSVLSRNDPVAIHNHLKQLVASWARLFHSADYYIVVVWTIQQVVMTDVWFYSLENFTPSGPLVDVRSFRGMNLSPDSGIAAGDSLVVLGREEEYRRRCETFAKYADRAFGGPDLPPGFVSSEFFTRCNGPAVRPESARLDRSVRVAV